MEGIAMSEKHTCPICSTETVPQAFSAGEEYYCPQCDDTALYETPSARLNRQSVEPPKMEEELEKARAEIARLRAGEADDPGHMGAEPTPAQWLRRFNDRTPEERLFVAESVMARVRESEEQRRQDEGRIITLTNRVAALEKNGNELFRNLQRARIILIQVRELKEYWAKKPGLNEIHDDLEVALEYEADEGDPLTAAIECVLLDHKDEIGGDDVDANISELAYVYERLTGWTVEQEG